MTLNSYRAFARSDAVAVLACVLAAVLVMCGLMTQAEQPSKGARSLLDANQMRNVYQSMIGFAKDNKDRFPVPGLINRLPDLPSPPGLGNVPGVGPEDPGLNTTANFFSAMIAQNYFQPEMLISPVERNPRVSVDADFDYNQYKPSNDVYWDEGFKADLAEGSNTSYAHLVIFGDRKTLEWQRTTNAKFGVLSSRGPEDGLIDPESITCGPHGNWAGNVVFQDNHAKFLSAVASDERTFTTANNEEKPDNFFAIDDGLGGKDMVLGFTKRIDKEGFQLQWD